MPTYTVVTFGCQMNVHDSDRIGDVLRRSGYSEVESPEGADVVVLNTCSVREKAEHKLRSEVGRLGLLKRERPELVIAVAGCVAQQEGEKLTRSMPQIDVVLGPDNIPELPALLRGVDSGAPAQVRTVFDYDSPSFLAASDDPKSAVTAFVTTMKGCDERCTFCIVPYTRGHERYRASGEILDEIERLVARGVREVTLLGQTVDSYRDPSGKLAPAPLAGAGTLRWGRRNASPEDETEFPALLRAIAQRVPELARLRYTSPHPRHLTPALVAAHRDLPALARHVHMPVQSGDNLVLKRMGRRYTREEYLERTQLLIDENPGLTISTDIIVGFPGETREQFEHTLDLVRERGFVGVFAFKYSQRPHTPALQFEDDVPEQEKGIRLNELLELSEQIRGAHLQRLVGSLQRVLVEGRSKSGSFTGRTAQNEIVHWGCQGDPTGEIVELRIVRALKHSLVAEMVDSGRRAPYASAPVERPVPRSLPLIG
ncbi:MAG TPA: MiaB/RimO family radical SAM methylthiotransferase [Polyangiaceae bacterium]|nr:MiaB/RimO family radical SAM methylthiotransferase [Polyangiaceae bacterium]